MFQVEPYNEVTVVEGNISTKIDGKLVTAVVKTTYKCDNRIIGAARVTVPIPNSATGSSEEQVFQYLMSLDFNGRKFNIAAVCGILANIKHETDAFSTVEFGDNGTSFGLCQWHNSRFTNLKNFCSKNNLDYTSIYGQIMFLRHELLQDSDCPGTLSELLKVTNDESGARTAGEKWCKLYERPKSKTSYINRGNLAANVYWPKYRFRGVS